MSIRSGSARLAAFAFSFFAAVAGLDASAAPPLVAPQGATQSTTGVVLRTRAVAPDFSILAAARDAVTATGAAQSIDIAFFDDKVLTISIERVERHQNRGVTNYFGTVVGDPLS